MGCGSSSVTKDSIKEPLTRTMQSVKRKSGDFYNEINGSKVDTGRTVRPATPLTATAQLIELAPRRPSILKPAITVAEKKAVDSVKIIETKIVEVSETSNAEDQPPGEQTEQPIKENSENAKPINVEEFVLTYEEGQLLHKSWKRKLTFASDTFFAEMIHVAATKSSAVKEIFLLKGESEIDENRLNEVSQRVALFWKNVNNSMSESNVDAVRETAYKVGAAHAYYSSEFQAMFWDVAAVSMLEVLQKAGAEHDELDVCERYIRLVVDAMIAGFAGETEFLKGERGEIAKTADDAWGDEPATRTENDDNDENKNDAESEEW